MNNVFVEHLEYWREPEPCGQHLDALLALGGVVRLGLLQQTRSDGLRKEYITQDGKTISIGFDLTDEFILSSEGDKGAVSYRVQKESFSIERILVGEKQTWSRRRDENLVGDELDYPDEVFVMLTQLQFGQQ